MTTVENIFYKDGKKYLQIRIWTACCKRNFLVLEEDGKYTDLEYNIECLWGTIESIKLAEKTIMKCERCKVGLSNMYKFQYTTKATGPESFSLCNNCVEVCLTRLLTSEKLGWENTKNIFNYLNEYKKKTV